MPERMSTTKTGYPETIGWSEERRYRIGNLQYLTTPQWAEWIEDRLHRRDPFPGPDPRQDEGPEYLFIHFIPQLGCARQSAELAIERLLAQAFARPWQAEPLCDLLYLVERLSVADCEVELRVYLENHSAPEAQAPANDPYLHALSALAALEKPRKNFPIADAARWNKWARKNPERYLPLCFNRLSEYDPDKAFQLLEVGDFADDELAGALLDEIEVLALRVRLSPEWQGFLGLVARKYVFLMPRIARILPDAVQDIDSEKNQPIIKTLYESVADFCGSMATKKCGGKSYFFAGPSETNNKITH